MPIRLRVRQRLLRVRGAARLMLVLVAAGCASDAPTAYDGAPPTGTPTASPSATVTAQLVGDGYGATSFVFSPSLVTIIVGGNVTFSNESGALHNVTFSGTSQDLPHGGLHVRTFNSAGTFGYSCTLHSGMGGSVTVVAP